MMWIIASVPFWALGCFMVASGYLCLVDGSETPANRAGPFLTGLLLAGILFVIAAKVAS